MPRRESFAQKAVRAQVVKRGGSPTLLELCLLRAGLRRGPQLVLSAWWWARVVRENPGNPTGERLAAVAGRSAATGYRYLSDLRNAFDDEELDRIVAQIERVCRSADLLSVSDEVGAARVGAERISGLALE